MKVLMRMVGRMLVAGVLASGLVAQAQNVKLRVGVPIVIDSAPFFAAVDQGYFKADGIDIEVTTSPVSNPLLTQLAAGQLDIAFSNIVTVSQAIENGLDFKVVLPGTLMKKGNDVNPCVVAIDSPIRTAKDMEGKRLASPALNNIIWLYARAWLEKGGADVNKVRIIEVPFPQMLDAVTTGQAEAVCPTEPFFTRAMESGKVRVLGHLPAAPPVLVAVVAGKTNANTLLGAQICPGPSRIRAGVLRRRPLAAHGRVVRVGGRDGDRAHCFPIQRIIF